MSASPRDVRIIMVCIRKQTYLKRYLAAGVLALVGVLGSHVAGQTPSRFVARLSTVPITVAMQDAVSGRGTVDATLAGSRLTFTGKFEGLRSPATIARLHLAPKATRGPAVGDLMVSSATTGTISGTIDLTPQQLQALDKSGLYVQVHSEKAPEGNLWGWLLPQETTK